MNEEKNKQAEEAWDSPEILPKMGKDEARDKGEAMMNHFVDLYALIDWSEDDLAYSPDPWVRVMFHKSGKFTIESYRDGGNVDEFHIGDVGELEQDAL